MLTLYYTSLFIAFILCSQKHISNAIIITLLAFTKKLKYFNEILKNKVLYYEHFKTCT